MFPFAIKPRHRWPLVGAACALALMLVGIVQTPPGTLPYPPESTYSDAALSHWPAAYFLRWSVLVDHQWPLWNPMRMLGQPFAANPLNIVWYPPQWLALVLPTTLHLNVLIYLHLAWLGLGMIAWARSSGLRPLTALLMGLAWGLNPKLMGHLGAGHLDILYALAWLPWLMWSTRRVAVAPALGRGALCGAITSLMVLADPRIAFYFLPVAILYGIVTSLPGTRPRRDLLVSAGLALVVVILLTAAQTLPLVGLSQYLTRASLTPREAADYSLPPRYLAGLLLPDVGGFHEWMTYLGLPVIGLSVFAFRDRARRWQVALWWVVAAAGLLWALGSFGPLYAPAVSLVPAVGWVRIPSRAWFAVAFALIVLSGYGLENVLQHGIGYAGRLLATVLLFGGLMALAAAAALPPASAGLLAGIGASLAGTGGGLWLIGSSRRGVVADDRRGGLTRPVMVGSCLLVATLALSLIGLDLTLIVAKPIQQVEGTEQAIIARLDPGCRTVYSPTFELTGPATTAAHITTLHGVDPFQLRASSEMIATIAGVQPAGYSIIAPPMLPGEFDVTSVRPDVSSLRDVGVCEVVSRVPLSVPGLELAGTAGGVSIYRVAPGDAQGEGNRVIFWRPEPVGVALVTTRVCDNGSQSVPTQIVVPQSWAPGWQAWLDGKAVRIDRLEQRAFMQIQANAYGCHTLALAYRPLPDLIGMGVSGATATALLAGFLIALLRWLKHR